MLVLISAGLYELKDMSIKARDIAKKCDILYLESYTNYLHFTPKELEEFLNKKIIILNREGLETKSSKILSEAQSKVVGILISGSALVATTHYHLISKAKKKRIKTKIVHGSSIFTAITEIGLSIYNFGKTTSIPFNNKNLKSPYQTFQLNQKQGMHTLFLLDLDPENNKFLSITQALTYLKDNGLKENTLVIGCARIGSDNQKIKAGKLKDILNFNFGKPPYCVIVPGKLHFIEEEALNLWK